MAALGAAEALTVGVVLTTPRAMSAAIDSAGWLVIWREQRPDRCCQCDQGGIEQGVGDRDALLDQ